MAEEYLQTAFEIKAACDELSRRLLRWHWEQQPGGHSFSALTKYIEKRRAESPEYYDRTPGMENKTSWQQLDTTLCMRILLDPEKDAAKPLDLLGQAQHPGAARRACNAVRIARNEAAHASDRAGSGTAALRFADAVECLEDAYMGTAFTEKDMRAYYAMSEDFQKRSGTITGKKAAAEKKASAEKSAAKKPRAASGSAKGSSGRKKSASSRTAQQKKKPRTASARGRGRTKHSGREEPGFSKGFLIALAAAAVIGLVLRGFSLGYLHF